jgi:hypothetical protein
VCSGITEAQLLRRRDQPDSRFYRLDLFCVLVAQDQHCGVPANILVVGHFVHVSRSGGVAT